MREWTKKNHGLMVNLYQVKKMLDEESIERTKEVLKELYNIERDNPYSEMHNLTFIEYVNAKRHWLACILGKVEYA